MDLIIAEKPSVARDIAEELGVTKRQRGALTSDKYVITWCIGHIARLAPPEQYNPEWKQWRAQDLPMLPNSFSLLPNKATKDQWHVLETLLTDNRFSRVINACDAGREGELIFRYVYEMAGSALPIYRLWLSSLTPSAIRKAFQELKPGEQYGSLYDAARSRSEADWLVGLNATRAMTLAARAQGHRGGVKSLGRVQTPTLALLVEREIAIRNHTPEPFYNVLATFTQDASSWEAQLVTNTEKDRIFDQAEAAAFLARLQAATSARVVAVEAKQKHVPPPLPYDLAALQREANTRLSMTAQQTLDAAQTLYERKLITYPRTDSAYLSEDMKDTIAGRLEALLVDPWGDPSLDSNLLSPDITTVAHRVLDSPAAFPPTSRLFHDAGVTDHHAIIPTETPPSADLLAALSPQDRALLELVQRRFLAQFLGPAIYSLASIKTETDNMVFLAKGNRLDSSGWQAIDPPHTKKDEKLLPVVNEGPAAVASARLHEGQTKPPPRYTEATLLTAMENAGSDLDDKELRKAMKHAGLGTAATRASIIETLLRRAFIARDGKSLVPTDEGEQLIASLPNKNHFSPALTARWEAALLQIEKGTFSRDAFMHRVRAFTTTIVNAIGATRLQFEAATTLGDCPLCSTAVTDIGSVYTCASGRDCNFLIGKKIAGRPIEPETVQALLSGATVGPLNGFVSKKGKSFSAHLVLDDKGRASLTFPR